MTVSGSANLEPLLIATLRAARTVVVLTGAGISAESGIPTFREALTGLWARFRPEELASPEAFQRDPQRVWAWYAERRARVREAQPNPGHIALAQFEREVPHFTLITQNVDGLHRRAGSSAVVELHGNIERVKCSREGTIVTSWAEGDDVPCCSSCGAYLRPDVVWFGEMLPAGALQTAQKAAESCDLFLSVGTSGLVEPAASLPFVALAAGATVVEINPDPTPLTRYASHTLRGPAGSILPALVEARRS